MNTDNSPRVLRVTSLKSFFDEVPSQGTADGRKPVVRLLNRQGGGEHSAALLLSLQGVNTADEIVWLCEVHTISWLYGKPFGQTAECIYAAMRDLESLVRNHLESRGYDVRDGDYGLPESVKPLAASFECARWVRASENEWKVDAETLPEGAQETA